MPSPRDLRRSCVVHAPTRAQSQGGLQSGGRLGRGWGTGWLGVNPGASRGVILLNKRRKVHNTCYFHRGHTHVATPQIKTQVSVLCDLACQGPGASRGAQCCLLGSSEILQASGGKGWS